MGNRRRLHPIPVPTWTCPHCGYVHGTATLLRLDFDHLRCRRCRRVFPAADLPTSGDDHPPAKPNSRSELALAENFHT